MLGWDAGDTEAFHRLQEGDQEESLKNGFENLNTDLVPNPSPLV